MQLVYTFQLRDPWECQPVEGGATRWERGFNCPTNIDPGHELWLIAAGLPAGARVAVNGQPVESSGAGPGGPFPVHDAMTDRGNRVTIAVPEAPPADGRFPYDVQLGIVAPND